MNPKLIKFVLLAIFSLPALAASAQKDSRDDYLDSLIATKDSAQVVQYLKAEQAKNPKDWWPVFSKAAFIARDENLDPSKKLAQEAIKLNPECTRCYVYLGRIAMAESKKEEARAHFEKALQINPKDRLATLFMGVYYEVMESRQLFAMEYYDQAIRIDKDFAYAYFTRGKSNFYTNFTREALADFDKAIALDSQLNEAYFYRCQIYVGLNEFEKAFKDAQTAYALDSTNAQTLVAMGACLSRLGRFAESVETYTKLVNAEPENPFYYVSRANVYYFMELMEEYCSDLSKADALSKGNEAFRKENDIDKLMKLTCDKRRPSYYFQRGVAAYNRQLYDTALQWYFRCDQLFPKHSFNMSFIGNAYLELGQYDSALVAYKQSNAWRSSLYNESIAVGKSPREAEVYVAGQQLFVQLYIAECFMMLGKLDSARSYLENVRPYTGLRDFPIAGYFYSLEAQYAFQNGQTDQAIAMINKAIFEEPENPRHRMKRVYYRLSKPLRTRIVSFRVGMTNEASPFGNSIEIPFDMGSGKSNLEECLSDCNRAIELSSNYWYAYLYRAQILMKLNRQAEACADYKTLEKVGIQVNVLAAPCAP